MKLVITLGKNNRAKRNSDNGFSIKTECDEQIPNNNLYFFIDCDPFKHGILIIKNKIIRYSNQSAAQMFGRDINQLNETNIFNTGVNDKIYKIREFYMTKPSTRDSFTYKTMLPPIYVQIMSKPIEYRGKQSDLLIIRDITHEKCPEMNHAERQSNA